MGGIQAALAEHAFEHLFIECLGWDRMRSSVSVTLPEITVELTAVAQKRGFIAFLCETHRTVLANRRLLRDIQQRLRKTHHEHILIHYSEAPRKQVWQWATKADGRKRLLHREHPFFSNDPPPRLLERIDCLSVSFQQEEQTTLPDVLERVRAALRPDGELSLFSKNPSLAAESDRRAMAMKRGEPGAFGRFVELHMRLARHWSRNLVRWFDMDPEDAEQTAMIGLIEAARRFDPERGFQFSTYAHFWLRERCQHYGPEWSLPIHIPPSVFWRCYRLQFTRTELIATHGERDSKVLFENAREAAGVSRTTWASFTAARHVDFLSEIGANRFAILTHRKVSAVEKPACSEELVDEMLRCMKCLSTRENRILRLRYGIGEREHTLKEIGEIFEITRERVRQIQLGAENRLQRAIAPLASGDEDLPSSRTPKRQRIEERARRLRVIFQARNRDVRRVADDA